MKESKKENDRLRKALSLGFIFVNRPTPDNEAAFREAIANVLLDDRLSREAEMNKPKGLCVPPPRYRKIEYHWLYSTKRRKMVLAEFMDDSTPRNMRWYGVEVDDDISRNDLGKPIRPRTDGYSPAAVYGWGLRYVKPIVPPKRRRPK